jgi:hypothetical protein
MAAAYVPQYNEMIYPTLLAVAELGGSASIGEIVETVIKREGFSDAQQAVLHHNGPETEIGYRLAWARTHLKGMGLLANSARGVWTLTDEGTSLVTDPSTSDDQRREKSVNWRPPTWLKHERRERRGNHRTTASLLQPSLQKSAAGKSSCSTSSWTCGPTPSNGLPSVCCARPTLTVSTSPGGAVTVGSTD